MQAICSGHDGSFFGISQRITYWSLVPTSTVFTWAVFSVDNFWEMQFVWPILESFVVALWSERYGFFFGTYQTTASLSLVPNCEEGARAVFYLTTSQKRKTPLSRCQREQIKISSFVCVVVNLFLYLEEQILSSFFLNIARGSFFIVCAFAVKNPMQVHFLCFCQLIGGSFFWFKGLIFNIFSC